VFATSAAGLSRAQDWVTRRAGERPALVVVEGSTTKEIMRSLKRYITRQLFRTLAAAHPTQAG
jgi:hypothetical protein